MKKKYNGQIQQTCPLSLSTLHKLYQKCPYFLFFQSFPLPHSLKNRLFQTTDSSYIINARPNHRRASHIRDFIYRKRARSDEHSDGSLLVVNERGTRSRDEEMRSRFPLRLLPSEKTKQDASSSRSDEHSDGSLLVVNERGTRSRDEEMCRIFFVFIKILVAFC